MIAQRAVGGRERDVVLVLDLVADVIFLAARDAGVRGGIRLERLGGGTERDAGVGLERGLGEVRGDPVVEIGAARVAAVLGRTCTRDRSRCRRRSRTPVGKSFPTGPTTRTARVASAGRCPARPAASCAGRRRSTRGAAGRPVVGRAPGSAMEAGTGARRRAGGGRGRGAGRRRRARARPVVETAVGASEREARARRDPAKSRRGRVADRAAAGVEAAEAAGGGAGRERAAAADADGLAGGPAAHGAIELQTTVVPAATRTVEVRHRAAGAAAVAAGRAAAVVAEGRGGGPSAGYGGGAGRGGSSGGAGRGGGSSGGAGRGGGSSGGAGRGGGSRGGAGEWWRVERRRGSRRVERRSGSWWRVERRRESRWRVERPRRRGTWRVERRRGWVPPRASLARRVTSSWTRPRRT